MTHFVSPCYPHWGSLTGTWRSYTQTWRSFCAPQALMSIAPGNATVAYAGYVAPLAVAIWAISPQNAGMLPLRALQPQPIGFTLIPLQAQLDGPFAFTIAPASRMQRGRATWRIS